MKRKISKIKTRDISKDTPEKDRYFGILLEDMNSKIDLVLEGHSALDKKIDNIKTELIDKIDSVDFKMNALNGEFQNLKSDTESNFKTVFKYLSNIKNEIMKINKRLDRLEKRMDNVENELKSIKSEIIDLKARASQKAELDKIEKLEKRIQKIELKLRLA